MFRIIKNYKKIQIKSCDTDWRLLLIHHKTGVDTIGITIFPFFILFFH